MSLLKPREGNPSEKAAHQLLAKVAIAAQQGAASAFAGYIESSAPWDIVFISYNSLGGDFYRDPAVRAALLPVLAPQLSSEQQAQSAWFKAQFPVWLADSYDRNRKKELSRRLKVIQQDSKKLHDTHPELRFWVCIVTQDNGLQQHNFGSIYNALEGEGYTASVLRAFTAA